MLTIRYGVKNMSKNNDSEEACASVAREKMEILTGAALDAAIREFTDPTRHDELIAHGWTARNGIWQPQYTCPITGVRLIQPSAWEAHLKMKAYGMDSADRSLNHDPFEALNDEINEECR